MLKFCCGITLFYPNEDELLAIKDYGEIFEKVFVFDNTDDESIKKNANKIRSYNSLNITYIAEGFNQGLSIAYNNMCELASNESFDYICLLDQDSIFSKGNIKMMFDVISTYDNKVTAVFCPQISYEHKQNHEVCNMNINLKEVDWAISSGSFIKLSIYSKTSKFDVNYFIDRIDYDYCFFIKAEGFKIIQVKGIQLEQKLGEVINNSISQHSPLRHYYVFRNRLYFYIIKNKKNGFMRYITSIILSLKHLFIVILFETKKREKMVMLCKGLNDFNKRKFGKY